MNIQIVVVREENEANKIEISDCLCDLCRETKRRVKQKPQLDPEGWQNFVFFALLLAVGVILM